MRELENTPLILCGHGLTAEIVALDPIAKSACRDIVSFELATRGGVIYLLP
jgi:hypothetical protein